MWPEGSWKRLETLCVHGMGSAVGVVDAVSLSLLLWAQGTLVLWGEGPCHLSRSPCTCMCVFTCVYSVVHMHRYECIWKPKVDVLLLSRLKQSLLQSPELSLTWEHG